MMTFSEITEGQCYKKGSPAEKHDLCATFRGHLSSSGALIHYNKC